MATIKKGTPQTRSLGRNIARLRTASDLTQESLAERADISARYVQDLEAGKYAPTVFVVERLRRVFDCTWDELLNGCFPVKAKRVPRAKS